MKRQFYASDEYKMQSYYYCVYLTVNIFSRSVQIQVANKFSCGGNDVNFPYSNDTINCHYYILVHAAHFLCVHALYLPSFSITTTAHAHESIMSRHLFNVP